MPNKSRAKVKANPENEWDELDWAIASHEFITRMANLEKKDRVGQTIIMPDGISKHRDRMAVLKGKKSSRKGITKESAARGANVVKSYDEYVKAFAAKNKEK